MYVVVLIVCALYAALYIRFRRRREKDESGERSNEKDKGIKGIFRGIAREIMLIAARFRRPLKRTEVTENLLRLKPGEKEDKLLNDYIQGKLSLSLAVILVGTLMAAGVHYSSTDSSGVLSGGVLAREDYNGESKEYSLDASTEEGTWKVDITVNPRKLSEDEVEEILPEFYEELGIALMGENPSLEEVRRDLKLVRKIKGYPFSVEWSSSDTGLVAAGTGKVSEVREPCSVVMTADVRYGKSRYESTYNVTIVPASDGNEADPEKGISELVNQADFESANSDKIILPESYEGRKIDWRISRKDYSLYVFAGVLSVAALIYKMSDRDLGAKLEEKKKKLKKDYPKILHKLVLYIGAGMTVKGAFLKTAAGGEGEKTPVYEEMIFSCREMKSGIPESEVYNRFGRRCGLQEYIRLSTLLGQNIKRGSNNLLERLREEADNASEDRIRECRKAGEEAVTKLLLPMVMMLVVVMVMILLPAFSNMNM